MCLQRAGYGTMHIFLPFSRIPCGTDAEEAEKTLNSRAVPLWQHLASDCTTISHGCLLF